MANINPNQENHSLLIHFLVLGTITLTPWNNAMMYNLIHISICICEQGFLGCLSETELVGYRVCMYFAYLTKAMAETSSFGGRWQQKLWYSATKSWHWQLECLCSVGSSQKTSHRMVWALFMKNWPLRLASRAPLRFCEPSIGSNKITKRGSVVYYCKSLIYARPGVGKLL